MEKRTIEVTSIQIYSKDRNTLMTLWEYNKPYNVVDHPDLAIRIRGADNSVYNAVAFIRAHDNVLADLEISRNHFMMIMSLDIYTKESEIPAVRASPLHDGPA